MFNNSPSSLSQAHPDHPTLKDLGVDIKANSSSSTSGGPNALTSPQQSATPLAMSDAEDSPNSSATGSGRELRRPGVGVLSDGPNARSKTVTVADGEDTFGILNRHPAAQRASKHKSTSTSQPTSAPSSGSATGHAGSLRGTFRVGVSEDRNKKCRRTMEDAHSFVYDYGAVCGQGYFAVFDGHAGKHAAEWCGQNFHEYLLDAILTSPEQPIPDLLNKTFHVVDSRLSQLAQSGKTQSGCTAVTAFLRVEHLKDSEPRGFINPDLSPRGLMEGRGEEELKAQIDGGAVGAEGAGSGGASDSRGLNRKGSSSGRRIRDFVRGLTGSDKKDEGHEEESQAAESRVEAIEPTSEKGLRRVLYTANVGDARAVLCRGGKAVRLTYDHKGSDSQEAKRITDAGGFVMNNRVNGVLAVTRSLGDASMKEFVVGSPYTTETTLDEQDEFLIVACDGLWDVAEDQQAVDLIRQIPDAQEASKKLLDFALSSYSTDNLSVMVVRFINK